MNAARRKPRRNRFSIAIIVFLSLVLLLLLYSFSLVDEEELKYLEGLPAPTNDSKAAPHTTERLRCTDKNNQLRETTAAPSFIIAGVQKGGTSALRGILVQHPQFIASSKFEPHFFDSKLQRYLRQKHGVSATTSADLPKDLLCDIQLHYIQSTFPGAVLDDKKYATFHYFEKTPSYLVSPNVPALIDRICSWKPKILVMLRDPIERAYSHYRMEREKLRVKEDFETAIRNEINYMRKVGLSAAPLPPLVDQATSSTEEKDLISQLKATQFQIPSAILLDPEGIGDQAHGEVIANFTNTNFLQRGMYAPQLARWLRYFPLGESLLVLTFEELQAYPDRTYKQILDFLGAPRYDLHPDDFDKAYRTRGKYRRKGMIHPPIRNETRQYLELFFQPYNAQLETLLNKQYYETKGN